MHNEIVMLFSDIKCFCKYSLQQVHNKLVVIRCPCDLKILSFFVKCNNPGNYAEDYQAFNLGIGKDLGLFGAFSFDITQANTTLADGTRHSGQSVKSVYSKSFYQTGTNIQVAGYRYSTQGFYNLSDSAYSRMSGYTVKPPTGDTNEQTQFIDYFNLFYSKRGQEQISISQQLGNYGTTFFSASRQSYWNTSRSDQQISFGLNLFQITVLLCQQAAALLIVVMSPWISRTFLEAQKYPLAYIAQANKSSHFIFRVPPLTVPDKCLLTQHLMQQKHREWVSL